MSVPGQQFVPATDTEPGYVTDADGRRVSLAELSRQSGMTRATWRRLLRPRTQRPERRNWLREPTTTRFVDWLLHYDAPTVRNMAAIEQRDAALRGATHAD